ncbi:MAG: AI-2E family transporter, partial [Rhodobacteraceae bacterium]|nr:AI-2E family transporter [Paracoccaceae bacterium]
MSEMSDRRIVDLVIRLMLVGLFIYSVAVMVAPMAGILIWAIILAVTLYPLWDVLRGWLGGRDVLASALLTLLGLLLTLGPVAVSLAGLINGGLKLADKIRAGETVVPSVPDWIENLPVVGNHAADIWTLFETNAHTAFTEYGNQILAVAQGVFGQVAHFGLGLMFLALAML